MRNPEMYVSRLFYLGSRPQLHVVPYLIILPRSFQVGSLPKNDIDVGTGLVGAPAYVFLCLGTTHS